MLVERKEVKKEDGNIGYIESVFKSDNILKTTYFPDSQRLYIAFSRGHTYSYGNISPEFYEKFEASDSHGKFFHQFINNKTSYPYRKEFTLYPQEVQDLKTIVENKIEENANENDDE
jgi:hypothetical protein